MSDKEIALAWKKAERLAENIYFAYVTGIGREQAKKDQINLRHWLNMVKEYGLAYNGSLDEYANLKL